MAFEQHGKYYYRKKRIGQSVVSEYVGGGLMAQMAALLDRLERDENLKKLEIERQTQAEFEQSWAQFKEFAGKVKDLVEATLLINGYHLTKNRIWRRSKKMTEITTATKNDATRENLEKLMPKVNKENPKSEDLQALKALLNEKPAIWQDLANLAEHLQKTIIHNTMPTSGFYAEVIKRKMREQRDDLGWETASPMERLVIRQVCLSYLTHHLSELKKSESISKGCSLREGLYWQKTSDATQKRYLRAIETLAKVQRLAAQTEEIQQRARAISSGNALKSANLLKALSS